MLLMLLLVEVLLAFSYGRADSSVICIESERDALFRLKQGLADHSNRLSSWVGEDCCSWKGVACSKENGHVIKLDLQNQLVSSATQSRFRGDMNHSLLSLTHLQYLDLSLNQFNSSIPRWLFNLSRTHYLNLSGNSLRGSIRNEIGNLNQLVILDLSHNELEGDMPETLRDLCNLQQLNLAHNKLSGHITAIFGNLTSCLKSSLKSLVLETNYFSGTVPFNLGNFQDLEILHLYSNAFHGPIPASIGRLASLRLLDLSHNYLNGSVPENFGRLSELEILDIHNNSLHGTISEVHFAELTRLNTLYLYENMLVFDVSPEWTPPFQIQMISLDSCKVGPRFPPWLRTQTNISVLEMSNTSISDRIPDWFENITSNIILLDLSRNQIHKDLPKLREAAGAPNRFIYLYSNRFEGPVIPFPSEVTELDLSNNLLWGHIPPEIGNIMPRLTLLHLFNNTLNGSIPDSICEIEELQYLDLSRNQLSGVPECWKRLKRLSVMDLSDNAISGNIPTSLGSLHQLRSLHLERNKLEGTIPASLKELKNLQILDLSENKIDGRFPSWIGENLSSLRVLNIDSNRIVGKIPSQLCYLNSMQILSLANNDMNGPIPSCFSNFSAMAATEGTLEEFWFRHPTTFGAAYGYQTVFYHENVLIYIKGLEQQYTSTLPFLFSIDVSGNNLVGQIPEELTTLAGLQNLNLSGNNLTGHIPSIIGNMKSLESLDMSRNGLSGTIPPSIAELNFLSHLSLAFNNLSGSIPSGNQLQTLTEESIYEGNHGLCGAPLKSCSEGGERIEEGEGDGVLVDMLWFNVGIAIGYVAGFVGVCSSLYFQASWRNKYFKFLDLVYSKLRRM